ncbi:MAG: hypothetical protein K6B64_01425, partial [Acholeplasmatales bacterium]|nr:hypothetical protein [Acholeplasmatales bacterium]
VSTIGKRIDDLDFLDDPKKNSIKIEIDATYLPNNYKKVEISSLVDLINFLDLDLKNTAVMTDALDTAKLLRFNDSPATEFNYSGTYLSYFYLHEIAGLILTKGVEDAIEVPDDAYEVGKLFITENEAKYIISALDTLSLDLNSFSFDPSSLTISDLKNAIFDGDGNTLSKILLTKAGKELMNSVTSLIIIESDYEALYGRITGKALYDFFNAVELMGVVNLDDDPDIANFNLNQTDDVLHTISISSIIRSTLIQYVNIEANGTHVDPLMYNNTSFVITANDKDNTNRSQLTQSETYNLMRSINYLSGGTGKVSDISLDIATIKALGDDERDIVLSTEILKYQVSKILLDLPLVGYKDFYTDDIALVEIIDITTLVTTPNTELLTKAQINKYIEDHA